MHKPNLIGPEAADCTNYSEWDRTNSYELAINSQFLEKKNKHEGPSLILIFSLTNAILKITPNAILQIPPNGILQIHMN